MSFVDELKRRKVVRVGVAYAVVAWILIQVIISVETPLNLPDWADTLLIVAVIAGFPITLILAWVFDVTPDGIRRTDGEVPPSSGPDEVSAAAASGQSIAVLPFADMSPEKDQEYFSDGIAEELLNQLSKLRGLHVAGRTSSFSFKGKNEDIRSIGEKLNVAHILEGSVRKAGNRIRITAQLIKASDGYHLWSENFDRDLDDIFAIQDETAKAVADALSVTLGVGNVEFGAGSTRNFQAYDNYLEGLAFSKQDGVENAEKAVAYLEKAVQIDPNFADAWGQLVYLYWMYGETYMSDKADEIYGKCDEAAQRAMAASPDATSSLTAMGIVHTRHRRWLDGVAMMKRAYELAPADPEVNYRYGNVIATLGRAAEAVKFLQVYARAESASPSAMAMLANITMLTGDLDAVMKLLDKTATLTDEGYQVSTGRAVVGLTTRDHGLIRDSLGGGLDSLPPGAHRDMTAKMLDLLESPDDARRELQQLYAESASQDRLFQVVLALWASFHRDDELALRIYRDMLPTNFASWFLIWRPLHVAMRNLPGFKDLVRNLGLVDYWRTTGNWGDFCRPIGENDFEVYR